MVGDTLVCVLLFALVAAGQDAPKVLHRAAEAAKSGRIAEALKLLDSVSSNPDLPAAYYHLRGALEARTGKWAPAEADLNRALQIDPHLADALYTLGLVELQLGKPTEAREALSKSIERNGQQAEAWLALGKAYLRLRENDKAEEAFRTAVQFGHGSFVILFGVGTAYHDQGDDQKAAPFFERAVALLKKWRQEKQPSPLLHTEIGIALAEARLYRDAIEEFRAALEQDQSLSDTKYNLAMAYYYAGQFEQSEKTVRELLSKTQTDELHHLLGLIYEQTGQPRRASEEFRQAATLNPRSEDYYVHLGRLALENGQYEEAERDFAQGSKICGANACFKSLIGLGTAYKLQGKTEVAERSFRDAIRERPKDSGGYLYLGDALIRAGRHREAEAPLKMAIELAPQSGLAHYMFAYALLKGTPNGNDEILFHLKEAIKLDPANALPYYRLGAIHSKAGNWARAATMLEQAVMLDPELKSAHYQLGLAYQKLGKADLAQREFQRVRASSQKALEEEQAMMGDFRRLSAH